jgi:hypothetical protein
MTKIYCIGDAHSSPDIPNTRFTWINKDIRKTKPDHVVIIGDFFSFDSLCSQVPNDSFEAKTKSTFEQDLDWGVQALEQITDKNEKLNWHYNGGNHEHRIFKFENTHPELPYLLSTKFLDSLLGIDYYPYGEVLYLDEVAFTHIPFTVMGRPYGGVHAEQRITNHITTDIVFGHSHRGQLVSAPKIGNVDPIKACNLGSALPYGYLQEYAQHSLTGWTYGTWLLTVEKGSIVSWTFKDMRQLKEEYA